MKNLAVLTLNKPNIQDFALERNKMLDSAESDWIFFIDSDEKASDALNKEIESAVSKNKFDGYYICRKNYFLGNYIGCDWIIRLGRKNAGRWKRRVHETWDIKGNVGYLKNCITHNTAESLHEYIDKIDMYSGLHAEANIKEGKRSNLFKIIFFPLGKFIYTYVKSRNVVFSIMQSLHSFLSWSKQWISQNV